MMPAPQLHLLAACQSHSTLELRHIKEYVAKSNSIRHQQGQNFALQLRPMKTLRNALEQAVVEPNKQLVLACAYPTSAIRLLQQEIDPQHTVSIISQPEQGTERYHTPTASLLEDRSITRVKSLADGVHKAALKFVAKQHGEMRMILRQSELESYFSLRFQIWHAMNYIPASSDLLHGDWEIDHFERFSLPIGLFTKQNELLACARLVQQFGLENKKHVRAIAKLLANTGRNEAARAFSYPGKVEQPFDILCEFRGFRDYYRTFVAQHLSVAEVSRVIVKPEYRGFGLAEVLVDSLITVAKVQDIDVLLLACREQLKTLYQHCAFKTVENLVSEQFLTIPEKSIVMKRTLA